MGIDKKQKHKSFQIFNKLPLPLKNYLTVFFNSLQKALPVGSSVILIGSSARNELTWIYENQKIRVLGDVEFLIFSDSYPKHLMAKITKEVIDSHYSKSFEGINTIELDFGVFNKLSLQMGVKGIWRFELQKAGVLIFGKNDLLNLTTKINIKNIDFASINYLILVRLWNAYSAIEKTKVISDPTIRENELMYIYLRNILDGLTVYLPWNGILVCGYEKRFLKFKELTKNNILSKFEQSFSNATQWKLTGLQDKPLELLKEEFLEIFGIINDYRPKKHRASFAFYVRGKMMIYKLQRGYFKKNKFLSMFNSLIISHNFIENKIINILLALHKNTGDSGKDSNEAWEYFIINSKRSFFKIQGDYNEEIDYGSELNLIMEFWFYGRSIRKV
ncbi:hypothetical protein N9770_05450 [Amylibacter sp.]|nr:hypothetical protein [Amylibacter sp.]